MAKITLNDVASTVASTSTATTINNNWDAIATAIENTLSRDGTSPNTMSADLDMNENHILNHPEPTDETHLTTKNYVDSLFEAIVEANGGTVNIGGTLGAGLDAFDDLTPAADRVPYWTGATTAALATLTSFGRSLIDDANAAAAITTLGLAAIYQPLDSDLTSIAALSTTSFGRGLLTETNAASLRTTAGLGTSATVNTGTSGATIPLLNGANTWSAAQTLTSAAPQLTLGVTATTLGSIKLFGSTSGDVTLAPAAAAGTATAITLPATTTTLAGLAVAQTFTATQTITPSTNTNALVVTGYSVTGSGTTALMSLAGTWNTTGNPAAIDMNITRTAAGSGTTFLLARDGSTVYAALGTPSSTYGALWLGPNSSTLTANNSVMSKTAAGATVLNTDSNSYIIGYENNATGLFSARYNRFIIPTDAWFGWSIDMTGSNAGNPRLYRDGADNILAQRVGTNAQTFRVYSTYTDASNYERGALNAGADYIELAAETAGTGDDNLDVRLTPAGTGNVRFGTHSALGAETVTGYITIKDSGGTTRKVAIVS